MLVTCVTVPALFQDDLEGGTNELQSNQGFPDPDRSRLLGPPMPCDYPEQYLDGIRLFNEEEFYECHDVFEELWSEMVGSEKKFVQGLIQAAVALFHFGNENFGGAKKLYLSARSNLDPYRPGCMGVQLEQFLADFDLCFQELLENTEVYPTSVVLRDELVPKIQLSFSEEGGH
jgi:uncharacterized protein